MLKNARTGPIAVPHQLHLGDFIVTLLDGGGLWLDGGAMFGIIPKPLWSRLVQVDEANRIPLATTCLLVETAGRRILIETGVGQASKFDDKERGFFSIGAHWIVDSLGAIGVERESIDLVILTHLHFDHAGGGTTADAGGGYSPTFPRAKYVVQEGEWRDAVEGHAVMTGTYRTENLAPLERGGVLSFVNGEAEIVPGIRVCPLPGHTRHQQSVILSGGGITAIQPADLMPTSAHLGLRYNMAYDLLPYENLANKERLLRESEAGRWMLLLGQDPANMAWRIGRDDRGRAVLSAV